jgi:hypothetical protein
MQMDADTLATDRRRVRSSDPQEALALQLSYVRSEAGLNALVFASHDGLQIAGSGDRDLCSELAAVAPLLSMGDAASAADIQHGLLFVREVYFEGTPLYLASCGDNVYESGPAEVDRWLIEATEGVTRILAA